MANWLLSLYSAFRRIPGSGTLVRYTSSVRKSDSRVCEAFGLKFKCPVGLVSGVVSNGYYTEDVDDLCFAYVQIGPIMLESEAREVISNLKGHTFRTKLSACLAPYTSALDAKVRVADMQKSFTFLFDFVDFFTVDLSGMETDGTPVVKTLDDVSLYLDKLLDLRMCFSDHCPILLKLSADCPQDLLDEIIDYCRYNGVNGIIVGGSAVNPDHSFNKCCKMVEYISNSSQRYYPVIAAGDINTADKAMKAYASGAWMVEAAHIFNWRHPRIVRDFCKVM